MLKKRRLPNFRRTLCVERLEDRMLLTGNVTAVEDANGVLTLTGDTNDNAIALAQNNGILIVNGLGTTINGQQVQTFKNVTALTILFLNGNDSIGFDGVMAPGIPGPITITVGTGNNTIMLDTVTFQRATITVGNETVGAVGSNLVDVSNDLITGNGNAGNVNVSIFNESGVGGKKLGTGAGVGPGSVNQLTMSGLQFTGGGHLNARVDDGVPYFDAQLQALTPASSVQADSINTAGNLNWTFGDHFQNVLLGSHAILNAANQTLSVGNDVDAVVATANINRHDTVKVGDVSLYPIPILPTPSVLVSGTVGSGLFGDGLVASFGSNANTTLTNGWPMEITETITALPGLLQGTGLLVTAGNGDALTVDPTMVTGNINITMGSGGVNGLESLTMLNCMSSDPKITFNSNAGDIVNINLTNLLVIDRTASLSVLDSGHGMDSVTLSNVHVAGSLSIILSNSGKNVVNAHNVTVLQGFIFGGAGIGNKYHDEGGNSGYVVFGFS